MPLGTVAGRDYSGVMSPRTRVATLAASLLLTLPTLAACGSGGSAGTAQDASGETTSAAPSASASDSTSETPSESTSASPTTVPSEEPVALPACSAVWVEGSKVPGGYVGCLDGGKTVPANGRYCEFGKALFTFQDTFYAAAGGPVIAAQRPLLKDPGYRDVLRKCGG